MDARAQRPPRSSKRTDALVRSIANTCRPSLQSELGRWLEASPRFRAFVETHEAKIRRKLTSANGEPGRLDVRAELLVAHLLLADRRFDVVFEAYGTGRLGPDLSVTFRANTRLNLEVTRLRTPDTPEADRLANIIGGKLRQLPPQATNAIVLVTEATEPLEAHVADALRTLRQHSDRNDWHGLASARAFNAHYLRLSGVVGLSQSTVHFVANREARRALPADAQSALLACLVSL